MAQAPRSDKVDSYTRVRSFIVSKKSGDFKIAKKRFKISKPLCWKILRKLILDHCWTGCMVVVSVHWSRFVRLTSRLTIPPSGIINDLDLTAATHHLRFRNQRLRLYGFPCKDRCTLKSIPEVTLKVRYQFHRSFKQMTLKRSTIVYFYFRPWPVMTLSLYDHDP